MVFGAPLLLLALSGWPEPERANSSTTCPSFDSFVDALVRSHTDGYGDLDRASRWEPEIARAREAGCYRLRPERSTWSTKLLLWASRASSSTITVELDDPRRGDFAIEVLCGVHASWARPIMERVIERSPRDPSHSSLNTCIDALSELEGDGFVAVERYFADPARVARLDYDQWLVEKPRLQPLFVRALREAERTRQAYRDHLYDDLCVERAQEVPVTAEVREVCLELSPDQGPRWAAKQALSTGLRRSIWVGGFLILLLLPHVRGSRFAVWSSWLPAGLAAGLAVFHLLPVRGSEVQAVASGLLNLVGSLLGGLLLAGFVAHATAKQPERVRNWSVLVAIVTLAAATILEPVLRAA
jgi:hypothetical protein